ncbi:MAG TPA: tryptophan synthase subunit alpha [Erysipelotrichaceae bacterium]|nr:hypothetical protein [Erysipelotrichia bacterium]HPX32486.1 tryptophan synthase subunit alpha [Erysipelotrichaceae bacterium]HQA85183.1 tryptophan synthase subunit alpha [Erysipelotrichaceae bacterium]
MKMICWFLSGFPSIEESEKILDIYVEAGCEAIEWSIPVSNPYREQDHLKPWAIEAYQKCSDYKKHLEEISKFKKKYPNIEVYPGIYMEMTNALGVDNIIKFFKNNNIATIFMVGTYTQDLIDSYKSAGLMLTQSSVSYYMKEEELAKAKDGNGFIYMQALPYESELKAGYTTNRLKECVTILRRECPNRPIYCAKGIRKPEDLKIIYESGADGYILGSLLINEYGDLEKLKKTIKEYKKYADGLVR